MKKILISLIIASIFIGCTEKEKLDSKVDESKDTIKIVFATLPRSKDENENRVFNAISSSNHQIKLSFKVQGNINYFKYKIGDEVKKDSLIAKIDSKPYELKVSQIEFGLKEAEALEKKAQIDYERVKKLYINQNASASDIDNAKAYYEASNAKVHNIKKELESAQLQLSYTKLYAPQDGYVGKKYVEENENISIGSPIVLLSDKIVDEVMVQVPENFINNIKINDKVEVFFDSLNDTKYEAKISEISQFASKETKLYQVIVKLGNSSDELKSGMSANVVFRNNQDMTNHIFFVPSNCVLKDNKDFFVYTLEKEQNYYLVKKQIVEVGELTQKGYEVLSGLSSNSMVLKAGMSEVSENMKVEIGNFEDLGN